jgi:hypothetical protein
MKMKRINANPIAGKMLMIRSANAYSSSVFIGRLRGEEQGKEDK